MNHYPDSRNGGIENVTRLLAEQLKGKGYSIHILFLYPSQFDHSDNSLFASCELIDPSQVGQKIAELIRKTEIDVIVNRCVIFASPIIRDAIKGTNCKLITTYNNKPTIDARKLKDIWTDKSIGLLAKVTIAVAYPIYKYRSINRLKHSHLRSYEASDRTVLLSKNYISEYAELYGVSTEKMVVINNPIKSGTSISETELNDKDKIVLMVTRLDEKQKCVIKALKVWKNLVNLYPNWKLQIVGSGPDETKIKDYQASKNIPNVEFIPACDPKEYYKKASIFLMTSRNEGWPNTLNEAMRYGCVPVVLATFSAIYDMIDDECNGYIISSEADEQDVKHLTDIVFTTMNNPVKLRHFAFAAIEKTSNLSIENIIPQWISLF